MKHQKGFTLLEILVVVVILAVLAALILPRMLSVSENAVIAEANQTLGALIRAQRQRMDLGDGFLVFYDPGGGIYDAALNFPKLGLRYPGESTADGSGPRFRYTCRNLTKPTCDAIRRGRLDGSTTEDHTRWVGLTIDGEWLCGDGYITTQNGCAPK